MDNKNTPLTTTDDKTVYARRIPVLGMVRKDADGRFFVEEHAKVAQAVGFSCPHCAKPILVRASVAGRLTAVCRRCGTQVAFVVDGKTQTTTLTPARLVWGRWKKRQEAYLREGATVIGRRDAARHADIEIDDPKASACSVCIMATKTDGDYEYRMKVLHATNPVFVNGIVLSPGGIVRLTHGITLRLGDTSIRFEI